MRSKPLLALAFYDSLSCRFSATDCPAHGTRSLTQGERGLSYNCSILTKRHTAAARAKDPSVSRVRVPNALGLFKHR